jgi:hypothetical protein
MLNTICIRALVLLPEQEGMYVKTHTYTDKQNYKGGSLSVVLGSECHCRRQDGARKLSIFMSLSSGFTVRPPVHEGRNISLHLKMLDLLLVTL